MLLLLHEPVKRLCKSVREVWSSRPGPVKSDAGLPAAHHRCDTFTDFEAALPRC